MVKNLPAMQEIWFNPCVGKIPWRREWLPTPVCVPGEFHEQRRLAGYHQRGQKESDTIEWPNTYLPHLWMESLKLPTFQDGGERDNACIGCRHSMWYMIRFQKMLSLSYNSVPEELNCYYNLWDLLSLICKSMAWNNGLVPNCKRSTSRLYIITLLIYFICRVHHAKFQAGRSTNWNQDCWEKY